MLALCDSMTGDHPARPVLVLSNDPKAKGLERAADRGITVAAVDHRPFGRNREAFEAELIKLLDAVGPDIICLAGFMRVLTPKFVGRYAGRMLNIHPSLLPKYKGLNTHARALEAGDAEAGCSVHVVTPELDDGPILGQARVKIDAGESVDTLSAKILVQEHKLYPAVLRRFAGGNTGLLELG